MLTYSAPESLCGQASQVCIITTDSPRFRLLCDDVTHSHHIDSSSLGVGRLQLQKHHSLDEIIENHRFQHRSANVEAYPRRVEIVVDKVIKIKSMLRTMETCLLPTPAGLACWAHHLAHCKKLTSI